MPKLNDPMNVESTTFEIFLSNDDIFYDAKVVDKYKNQRKSVRYVRRDITAFISQPDIFGCYSLFAYSRTIRVKLLDISSQGVLIGGPSKLVLKINQKVLLMLIFNTNKKFEIPATVTRQLVEGRTFYGIKFNKVNDDLGDYLLESPHDLIFK
jgi:hypothetical protein